MSFSGIDENINCVNCKESFTFTVGEQEYFTRLALDRAPKRCLKCRRDKRANQNGGYNATGGYNSGGYQAPIQPSKPPSLEDDANSNDTGRRKSRRRDRGDDFDY